MIDLSNNLVRHIGLLYRYMMRVLEAETAPLGMGAGRFSYLFILYLGDGLSQQEIAYRLQADKAAVARTLAQLEVQGYVERRGDPEDRRITRVFLTDKSRSLQSDLELAVERVINRLNDRQNPEQQKAIRDGLSQMLTSLNEHYEVPNNKD